MNLTDLDYELLSAYIDDALAPEERAELEARLESEPELRSELQALRQVVALVNTLPMLKAPRNFTLTPDALQQATGGELFEEPAAQSPTEVPPVVQFPATKSDSGRIRRSSTTTWLIGVAASLLVAFLCVTTVVAPYLGDLFGGTSNVFSPDSDDGVGSVASVPTATSDVAEMTLRSEQAQFTEEALATISTKTSAETVIPLGTPTLGEETLDAFEPSATGHAAESMVTETDALPESEENLATFSMEAQEEAATMQDVAPPSQGDVPPDAEGEMSDTLLYESAPADMDAADGADETSLRMAPAPMLGEDDVMQQQMLPESLNSIQRGVISLIYWLIMILLYL